MRARTRPIRIGAAVMAILLSVLLVGCGSRDRDSSRREATEQPLYSPNGEPLSGGPLGHPPCEQAIPGWFDRLDGDRKGAIDLDQYLTDARRQFAAMDLNKDGLITAEVLARYRAPYEPASRADQAVTGPRSPENASRAAPGQHRQARTSGDDRGRFAEDEPDPVMAADVTLQFKVTLADFVDYERRRFVELNSKHDGRLTRAEVLAVCQGDRKQ